MGGSHTNCVQYAPASEAESDFADIPPPSLASESEGRGIAPTHSESIEAGSERPHTLKGGTDVAPNAARADATDYGPKSQSSSSRNFDREGK